MRPRQLLVTAAVLGVLSLGLAWGPEAAATGAALQPLAASQTPPSGTLIAVAIGGVESASPGPGFTHPVRFLGVAAAAGLWLAWRRGSRRLAWWALLLGAVALPIGLTAGSLGSGRVVYVAALGVAGLAVLSWRAEPDRPEPSAGRPA